MASLNRAQVMGNLGQDPEVRYTPGGQAVGLLSVASNERWTDKDGKVQERTEWHRITVWGKQAENCGKYLKKGRPVYVEGRLQTRKYTDKDGIEKYSTEIVCQMIQFLGTPPRAGEAPPPGDADAPQDGQGGYGPKGDDDIPF